MEPLALPLTGQGVFLLPSDANAPFAQWSTERVCAWLEDFGLAQYVIFARQWVTSGHTLLTATPQDMEKVRAEPEIRRFPFFPKSMPGKVNPPTLPHASSTLNPHTGEWREEARLPLLLQIDPLTLCRVPLPFRWNIYTHRASSEGQAAC